MALYDEGEFVRAIAVLEEVIVRYPKHAQRGGGAVQYRGFLLPDGQLALGRSSIRGGCRGFRGKRGRMARLGICPQQSGDDRPRVLRRGGRGMNRRTLLDRILEE